MRRITNNEYDAHATQGATAPMRRIRRGVLGGRRARNHERTNV